MSTRILRAFLAFSALLLTCIGFSIFSTAPIFTELSPALAHPGTPEPDSDGDSVPDDFDLCPGISGAPFNAGCPVEQQQQPTAVPPTAIPPTATPNPVTLRNFPPADEEAILALLESGDTVTVDDPVTLADTTGNPYNVTGELQSLGEFTGQGYIAAQQGYLFLNGRGDLFVTVGANIPSVNAIVSGDMTFTSDGSEFEICSLSARVVRDGGRNAQTMLDLALVNDGSVALIDRTDPAEDAVINVAALGLDLAVAHRMMMIVTGETVDVFVDGAVVMDDIAVTSREGVYGMSMIGRAETRPRCEVRNFWVFVF